ncbi:MAG: peptidylprolyl isomerase [Candidatus Marinimicrobia bacterium]|nr:peptidylprolyl isomerase [Candidatus Neomarinimicrobiota bacterium]|tara:strand:+ start:231 stop:839 length:609 start_codon:yes stop_codon:yes gene_type:complete
MMIGCGKTKGNKMDEENSGKSELKTNDPEKEITVISTKFGDISLEFFDELAPKHVESFKLHAQNDYYNGTIFHRVIPGFMIQGGDPLTRSKDRSRHGTGGNAAKYFGVGRESEPNTWDLPAEFSSRTHSRGILSMARSQDPDSGGSQFFICVADAPFLNGQYTVFGRVIKGMDVVDQIVNAPRDQRDNPNDRIEMEVRIEKR